MKLSAFVPKFSAFSGTIALALVLAIAVHGQWIRQEAGTSSDLRGLAVVNEKVVWASGTGGTVIRTIDGGQTWTVVKVPGAEKLDFRDVEAFDANIAYVLSIGSRRDSQIHKTTDGGATWKAQFINDRPALFFDAIACWDPDNCLAMSDPMNGKFYLIATSDSGKTWKPIDQAGMPDTTLSEAAFAASGTCLIARGKDTAYLVSGGGNARVFRSIDRGNSWSVVDSTLVKGRPGTGIFSIAMYDTMTGVIVGGDYEKPAETQGTLAFTADGGKTWKAGAGLSGYRSGVAYVDKRTVIAVGTNGSDISADGGKNWKVLGREDLNAVQAKGKRAVWAVGPKGGVYKLR